MTRSLDEIIVEVNAKTEKVIQEQIEALKYLDSRAFRCRILGDLAGEEWYRNAARTERRFLEILVRPATLPETIEQLKFIATEYTDAALNEGLYSVARRQLGFRDSEIVISLLRHLSEGLRLGADGFLWSRTAAGAEERRKALRSILKWMEEGLINTDEQHSQKENGGVNNE